ncbi:MAG: DUF3179 domain-containing (seleno)protein [Jiangellaceae bacterium]
MTCLVVAVIGLVAACTGTPPAPDTGPTPAAAPPGYQYPDPPPAPDGPLGGAVDDAIAALVAGLAAKELDTTAVEHIAVSKDARLGWFLADVLRFIQQGPEQQQLLAAFEAVMSVDPSADPTFATNPWRSVTNHLIAWDLPAHRGYREDKAGLFTLIEPGWRPFFDDAESAIDWRIVSWGGVQIDNRPLGDDQPCPRGCIPALDDPELVSGEAGRWYPDDALVFGVEVNGEAVAFPKNMMEVHELVNITIGRSRLGIPYCTLCGSAQAYLTDDVPAGIEPLVLRTSGLLSRSNKVMYDLGTLSVFDTFTGEAVSGPLHRAGFVLEQVSVVTTTWGEWRAAHPASRIVAEDGGIGQTYPADPLQGRDDAGPIFAVGPVDERFPVHAQVLGVVIADGTAVAFPVDQALAALGQGRHVSVGEVEAYVDAGGLRARMVGGDELPTHQAFWFAWSQFHPGTLVWTPIG